MRLGGGTTHLLPMAVAFALLAAFMGLGVVLLAVYSSKNGNKKKP
jgi:hypothetical protein